MSAITTTEVDLAESSTGQVLMGNSLRSRWADIEFPEFLLVAGRAGRRPTEETEVTLPFPDSALCDYGSEDRILTRSTDDHEGFINKHSALHQSSAHTIT